MKKVRFVKALHALSNGSKIILYSSVFALFILHIFLSVYLADFTWFGAFGALLSIFGLLVSLSYALPLEDIDPKDLTPTEEGEHYVLGGLPLAEVVSETKTIDTIKQSNIKRVHKNYENISTYIIFTVAGTLIWAYAGFLNTFFCS